MVSAVCYAYAMLLYTYRSCSCHRLTFVNAAFTAPAAGTSDACFRLLAV